MIGMTEPAQEQPYRARSRPPTRVVIAEDMYLVREALEQVLGRIDGIEIVGSCTCPRSLRRDLAGPAARLAKINRLQAA